jgi:hypothetical protein
MGLKRRGSRSSDAIRESSAAMPRIASGLRSWLLRLCQSRSGQCLHDDANPLAAPLPPGEGREVRGKGSTPN